MAMLPRAAAMWAEWRSPEVVFSVSTDDRVVALTLDDGPSSATPRLLDVLGGSEVYRPGGGWCDHRMIREARERGYRTAEILRRVLPELRSRGYRIVSVSRCRWKRGRKEPRVTTRRPRGRRGR